jgi:hypothetical protein
MDQRAVRRLEREGYIVTANELSRCTRKGLEAAPQEIAECVIARRAETMATETNPAAALSKGAVLVNRRGCRLHVKSAGPKFVVLAERDHRYFIGDRVPRNFVERRIASGYYTIAAS